MQTADSYGTDVEILDFQPEGLSFNSRMDNSEFLTNMSVTCGNDG